MRSNIPDLPTSSGRTSLEHTRELVLQRQYLLSLANRMVRDESTAEDLVHETLVRSLRLKQRPEGSWYAYLHGILRKVARERQRDAQRRLWRERRHARSLRAVESRRSELEGQETLLQLLGCLGDASREVMWLHYVEGLTVARIAALREESIAAIKARIFRSTRTLRMQKSLA